MIAILLIVIIAILLIVVLAILLIVTARGTEGRTRERQRAGRGGTAGRAGEGTVHVEMFTSQIRLRTLRAKFG